MCETKTVSISLCKSNAPFNEQNKQLLTNSHNQHRTTVEHDTMTSNCCNWQRTLYMLYFWDTKKPFTVSEMTFKDHSTSSQTKQARYTYFLRQYSSNDLEGGSRSLAMATHHFLLVVWSNCVSCLISIWDIQRQTTACVTCHSRSLTMASFYTSHTTSYLSLALIASCTVSEIFDTEESWPWNPANLWMICTSMKSTELFLLLIVSVGSIIINFYTASKQVSPRISYVGKDAALRS